MKLVRLTTLLTLAAAWLVFALPATADDVQVNIVDFAFAPADLTINAGDTVIWTNVGERPHTTTSDRASFELWDSERLDPGESFDFMFEDPGRFTYHCVVHPFMQGTISVMPAPEDSD